MMQDESSSILPTLATLAWHSVVPLLIAIAFLVLIVTTGQAQTTSSGITINDPLGFIEWSDRRIAKETRKKRRNLGDNIAGQYEMNALEVRNTPQWADTFYGEVKAEFSRCMNTSAVNPSAISVELKKKPFDTLLDYSVSGVTYADGRIIIVYWNISDTVGVQTMKTLLKGEMRHYFWVKIKGFYRELWGVPDVCN